MPPKVEEEFSVIDHFDMLRLGLLDSVTEQEETKRHADPMNPNRLLAFAEFEHLE